MSRDGAITFADLIGKLDLLRVACDKCGRDGYYGLNRLSPDLEDRARGKDKVATINPANTRIVRSSEKRNLMTLPHQLFEPDMPRCPTCHAACS